MNTTRCLCVAFGVFTAACSSAATEPEAGPRAATASQALVPLTPGDSPGFQMEARLSRFALGATVGSRVEMGMVKTVGKEGVVAVDDVNGSLLSVPNADAAATRVAPFGASVVEHNDRARAYFVGAGLNADEIASVSGHVGGTIGSAEPRLQVTPDVVAPTAYYSVLNRAVDGIPVPDSFAWVRINANDEVVSEGVYWPRIPASVRAAAKRFEASVTEKGRDAFRGGLPAGLDKGRVVIRHSSFAVRGGASPVVSYDVVEKAGSSSAVRHFDELGSEMRLAQEEREMSVRAVRGKGKQP